MYTTRFVVRNKITRGHENRLVLTRSIVVDNVYAIIIVTILRILHTYSGVYRGGS